MLERVRSLVKAQDLTRKLVWVCVLVLVRVLMLVPVLAGTLTLALVGMKWRLRLTVDSVSAEVL
jgi:hypothetical protein